MTNKNLRGRGHWPLPRAVALVAALALPLGACSVDDLLEVDDLDVATPGSVGTEAALPVVYAGALADFAEAFGGSGNTGGGSANEGQILLSGLLGDEFQGLDTFDTRIQIDQRAILLSGPNGESSTNGQLEDAERNLHRARRAAENGADLFSDVNQGTDPRRAELMAIAGYTYVFFGENYCAGVPFSHIPREGGEATFGTPQTTAQIFQTAVAKFDSALAIQSTGLEGNLAKVGKGRALLNLGDRAGAAAAVAGVPADFNYQIFYSDNTVRQENGVFHYAKSNKRYGVAEREGGEGLPYRSSNDPRVRYSNNGRPFDTSLTIDHFAQEKYPERGSEISLANGIEARLIRAEAALNGGSAVAGVDSLQAIRTTYNNATAGTANDLPAIVDPGTAAGRVDLLFQERAFWLWLTSHRLGDMRRLIRQYSRSEATVFPSGAYELRAGNTFGTDKNLPIFVDEANNPNFSGCIDRNA